MSIVEGRGSSEDGGRDDAPGAFDGDPSWRKTHALADGTVVRLRPILPTDKDALRAGFHAQSPQSRYMRFGALVELTEPMLRYLTEVDQRNHIALVATVDSPDLKGERGVGVARLIRLHAGGTVAEAAVSVADDMQRRGIGTLLVKELAAAAVAQGIERIRAEVLSDNVTMRAILQGAGAQPLASSAEQGAGTQVYDLTIQPEGASEVPSTRARHEERLAARMLAVLRGAAETMAVQFGKMVPDEARALFERARLELERSGAATAATAEAGEREADAEREDGARRGPTRRP